MSYKPLPYASIEVPLSTQEISERASDFDYDSNIPLKHWLRTTLILLREVKRDLETWSIKLEALTT